LRLDELDDGAAEDVDLRLFGLKGGMTRLGS
jgi:hypothetical protein